MFRADTAKAVAFYSSFLARVFNASTPVIAPIMVVIASVQLLASSAFAQDAAPGAAPSPILQFVPIIVMVGVMYFLMIRPQATRQKTHQSFVSTLKRGDEVVTASGILGRIEGLTDQFVTLEVAPNTRIKILRSQIASSATTAINAAAAKEVNP